MNRTKLIAWIALTTCGGLRAQRVSIDASVRASDKAYVQATGEAAVSAKPDQATIDIGVVTQGVTAAVAGSQNARQTDSVLGDLRKVIAPSDQLKTISYSVRPTYQSPKPGATATITGYVAANVVEVVLSDLDQVGKVIDAGLQSGANNIQKLQYGLKNLQAARSKALQEAAIQARASAEAIASGLGVHVVRVLSAEEYEPEDGFGLQKAAPVSAPGFAAVPTQLEAGTVEVRGIVLLKLEVAPQ